MKTVGIVKTVTACLVKSVEDNKLSLRFKNGSQIKAVSSKGDAGRSEALSLLVIDEAAFISDEDIEDAMKHWKEEAPAQFKELLEADNAE